MFTRRALSAVCLVPRLWTVLPLEVIYLHIGDPPPHEALLCTCRDTRVQDMASGTLQENFNGCRCDYNRSHVCRRLGPGE